MQLKYVDLNKLRGLGDKSIGLYKEFLGTVLDRDSLVEEGEAQQARGSEQLKALRAEARAEQAERRAEANEDRQRAAQRVKRSA